MNGKDMYSRQHGSPEEATKKTGFKGNSENAKTRLCTRWKNGDCRFGDRCNFAHGEHELRRIPGRGGGRASRGRGGGRGPLAGRTSHAIVHDKLQLDTPQPVAGRTPAANIPNGYSVSTASNSNMHGAHASPDSHTSSHLNGVLGYPNNGMPENVWAACGFPLAGANGWVMYRVQETGEPYYHHAERNITQWDQPPDFIEH